MVLLEVQDVKRHFGAVKAVDGVSFEVAAGEVRAIIGPNGAGKSTLFNVIAGRVQPTAGSVHFNGRSLRGLPPHRVVERGIGVTFQVARIFDGLTLHENVLTAVFVHRRQIRSVFRRMSALRDAHRKVDETLELVGLAQLADEDCAVLSHGDRKALEIAIALASNPRMLLLDEPTAGMSVGERKAIVGLLSRIGREFGTTIVFTEHDMDMVLTFADRITFMVRGCVLAEGTPAEIRANTAVRAAYLGRRDA